MKNKHSTFPKHLLRTLPLVSTEVAVQQLTEIRRQKGQFYTPPNLARHGWAYLGLQLRRRRIGNQCDSEFRFAMGILYTYIKRCTETVRTL